jgi:hypothetical protein
MGSVFDDGEIYIQSLLSQLAQPETWRAVVKNSAQENAEISCPLSYTSNELAKQEQDLAKWELAIERKAQLIDQIGLYTGWDGAVPPEQYNTLSQKLEAAKEQFLDEEAKTSEEREQWAHAWPFQSR